MKKNPDTISITEGITEVLVYKTKESKKGPGVKNKLPFYNPTMELNRDFSILLCQWIINNSKKHVSLLDGLAASGIRGFRLANELCGDFDVTINDRDKNAYELIKKNAEKLELKNIKILNCNLSTLLTEKKFTYIDIDPFGSPVYFIDSAMQSIAHEGVIACTATDTATLCGVYPMVCFRRYAAMPYHSDVMKEIGLRILLGFICKEAGKHDKGIKPLVCYSTDHYFRVYVQIFNSVKKANESMKYYSFIKPGEHVGYEITKKFIGPIWTGKLQHKKIFEQLRIILFEKQLKTRNVLWKLIDLLEEEADSPMFFYTSDNISSILKKPQPKMKTLFEGLRKKGFEVTRTHFNVKGFKTNAPVNEIEKMFK
ncbi:MAG: tRNA (guanine(10)-N(2))-dimethyltransferase [Candidatus Thermoplasmatota archaeon]|nr:tRNA (guanine(10)-N(2))-dimethyltransferase [Candidatus Thermoplasmatota archaeon]